MLPKVSLCIRVSAPGRPPSLTSQREGQKYKVQTKFFIFCFEIKETTGKTELVNEPYLTGGFTIFLALPTVTSTHLIWFYKSRYFRPTIRLWYFIFNYCFLSVHTVLALRRNDFQYVFSAGHFLHNHFGTAVTAYKTHISIFITDT